MSDSDQRISSLTVDEDSGEMRLLLPPYEEGELMTFTSLLLMEIAHRLSTDDEWCDNLVAEATTRLTSEPTTIQ